MESEPGLTRGFLFADLRGYSLFSETRGDAAAAALLTRYRAIVRGIIAGSDGAEIRTEGDSFYIVFRSASGAVRAGLAIVAAAAAEARDHPDAPITVGIGIHAGEAIESDEGPIGSAVNIAARICAAARPGEVLVSDTIHGLTRTGIEARFVTRGRPRLKGIQVPIELFAVVAPGTVQVVARGLVRSSLPTPLVSAIVGIAAVIVIGALAMNGGLHPGAAPPTSSQGPTFDGTAPPTPEPTPVALRFGELAAGDYVSARFRPQVQLTLPPGWGLVNEIEGRIILSPMSDPTSWGMINDGDLDIRSGQLVIGSIKAGWTDCTGDSTGDATIIGPTSQDLLDWLAANQLVTIGSIEPIATGGQTAIRVRVTATDACAVGHLHGVPVLRFVSSAPLAVPYRPSGDGFLWVFPGSTFDLFVIDLQAQAMSAVAILPRDDAEARRFAALAAAVVRTTTFDLP